MKRLFIISLLLIVLIPCLEAQRKEISQARTYVKSGSNFDKAEQLMVKLLKDSVNSENMKIHLILTEALRKQYEAGNEKLYLKQKIDTASFFNVLRKIFLAYETMDSLDSKPDVKGNIRIKYREKNATYLNDYRENLYNAGTFFINKQKYEDAYNFLDIYLDCTNQPLFSSYHYGENPSAAYWALFSGYKLQNPSKVLKYANMAKKDTTHLEYTLQYLAETYKTIKDTIKYVNVLQKGFEFYKQSDYFFTYLVSYFSSIQQLDSALIVVNQALEYNDSSLLYLYAKSNLLLNTGQYEECIKICNRILSLDKQYADAYYNAGISYINMAFEKNKSRKFDAEKKKQIKNYYQNSLPYMEKYRELKPMEKDKWGAALYNIYLQLNMGKQFEEIDKLLR